jgi:UDPglucose 6-dehydrogenase
MTAAAAVRQSRIFVVGAGVVGKATGEGFLAAGHDVTFVDISPSRVAQLRRLGLDAREELVLDGEPPSFVFLTLPTPNDGHRYDLSALESGTAAVGVAIGAAGMRTPHDDGVGVAVPAAGNEAAGNEAARHEGADVEAPRDGVPLGAARRSDADHDHDAAQGCVPPPTRSGHTVVGTHTVVVRSTVPPGTTDGLVKRTLEAASGRTVGSGFALASNPEFLRAACAAEDFRHPWMTVIASRSARTVERLAGLLRPFGGELRTFADPAAAELLKCAHNIFNATKISFWNEMWLVARRLGLDLDGIASVVARSAEGSFNPEYGIRGGAPFGGVCLPKDTRGFLGFAEAIGVEMPLLRATVKVNDRLAAIVTGEVAALEEAADARGTQGDIGAVPVARDGASEVSAMRTRPAGVAGR